MVDVNSFMGSFAAAYKHTSGERATDELKAEILQRAPAFSTYVSQFAAGTLTAPELVTEVLALLDSCKSVTRVGAVTINTLAGACVELAAKLNELGVALTVAAEKRNARKPLLVVVH